jgi:hypothetical protein
LKKLAVIVCSFRHSTKRITVVISKKEEKKKRRRDNKLYNRLKDREKTPAVKFDNEGGESQVISHSGIPIVFLQRLLSH